MSKGKIMISGFINFNNRELKNLKVDLSIPTNTWISGIGYTESKDGIGRIVDKTTMRELYSFGSGSTSPCVVSNDGKEKVVIIEERETGEIGDIMYKIDLLTGNVYRVPFIVFSLLKKDGGSQETYYYINRDYDYLVSILEILSSVFKDDLIYVRLSDKYTRLGDIKVARENNRIYLSARDNEFVIKDE